MTDTTSAQGEHAPLWSDDRIHGWVNSVRFNTIICGTTRHVVSAIEAELLAETIRDDYEATLTSLRQQLADADAEMVKLKMWLNATNDLLNEEEADHANG